MKLNLKHYGIQKQLSMNKINNIVLESPVSYRKLCGEMKNSWMTNDEGLIFEEDGKILCNNKEVEVIESLFTLDFGNKRIMKMLVDNLTKLAMNDQFYMKTQSALATMENLMEEIIYELPCEICREPLDIVALMKSTIKGVEASMDYVERMDDYIKLMSRLLHIKIIVMFGMAKAFTYDEWRKLHEDAEYEGIYLLLIEQETYLENCDKVVIDKDDCWVV